MQCMTRNQRLLNLIMLRGINSFICWLLTGIEVMAHVREQLKKAPAVIVGIENAKNVLAMVRRVHLNGSNEGVSCSTDSQN
jgi:hypothetical protein